MHIPFQVAEGRYSRLPTDQEVESDRSGSWIWPGGWPSRFGICMRLPCKGCPILARCSRGWDSRMCGTPFFILSLARTDALTTAELDSRNRMANGRIESKKEQ